MQQNKRKWKNYKRENVPTEPMMRSSKNAARGK